MTNAEALQKMVLEKFGINLSIEIIRSIDCLKCDCRDDEGIIVDCERCPFNWGDYRFFWDDTYDPQKKLVGEVM